MARTHVGAHTDEEELHRHVRPRAWRNSEEEERAIERAAVTLRVDGWT